MRKKRRRPRKVVCCHKQDARKKKDQGRWSVATRRGREKKRKEKDQGRREGGSAKARFRVSSTKKFLFLVYEYLGSERPILVEVLAPMRLSLQGSHARRKFRQRTTLRRESSTLKGLLYAPIKQEQYHKRTTLCRFKSRCKLFVARKAALSPWSKA